MKSMRLWVLWLAAAVVIAMYWATDPDGGRETLARLQYLAWIVVVLGPVYLARRGLVPYVNGDSVYTKAMKTGTGAGLVFLGLCVLTGFLLLVFAGRAGANVPPRAIEYLPVLADEIERNWPKIPKRSVLGALVEQETCPSAAHRHCWNPRAELKTAREYGFGLGQLTIAYRADGSERFNRFREVSGPDWQWEDRYDARQQLRAMVLMNRACFERLRRLVGSDLEAMTMCDAAYNGGEGGLMAERRLCAAHANCDPDRWFGHVEHRSLKSREKWQGYGKSAFEINREHVKNVMVVRRPKYVAWFGERG